MNKITAANLYWRILPFACLILILSGCGEVLSRTQVIPQTQIIPVTQIIPATQIVQITPTTPAVTRSSAAGPTAAAEVTQVGPSSSVVFVSGQQDWQDSGIPLEAGSQVSFSYVAGAWNVDFEDGSSGYAGPDGYPLPTETEAGCDPAPVTDAPTGALLARVGDGPAFVAGSFLTFSPQQEGKLFFRINDGCLENNDGRIALQVDRLEAGSNPAAASEPAEAQTAAVIQFTVAADKGFWQDGGVPLEKGQAGTIRYMYGVWSFNLRGGSQYFVGPAGYPYHYTSVLSGKCGSLPLAGAPFGALLARAGGGMPFVVGRETAFQAEKQGNLLFRINDDCMGDDWGQITVEVKLTDRP